MTAAPIEAPAPEASPPETAATVPGVTSHDEPRLARLTHDAYRARLHALAVYRRTHRAP